MVGPVRGVWFVNSSIFPPLAMAEKRMPDEYSWASGFRDRLEHVMTDGTCVHAHKHSAGAWHPSGENRAIGRRRRALAYLRDASGNLIAFAIMTDQKSEYPQVNNLFKLYHNRTVSADKGHDSRNTNRLHSQGARLFFPGEGRVIIPCARQAPLIRNVILPKSSLGRLKI